MYDAIVVGARCAGSPVAMLLARQGHRVLLVDRASFPSDRMSTHYLHQPALAILARWGLLEQATRGVPAIERVQLVMGSVTLRGTAPTVDGQVDCYGPRRTHLDKVLVDAAADAGAEVREGFTLDSLVWDQGRVSGIVGHGPSGARVVEHSTVLVGADGTASAVAKLVEASKYNEVAPQACGLYSYFSDIDAPTAMVEQVFQDGRSLVRFPTNDGAHLVWVGAGNESWESMLANRESALLQTREFAPDLGARVLAGHRVEPWTNVKGVPNFFRQASGPGWALVGDAGYTKDPVTAQGIHDSWKHAELLADAIHAGLSGEKQLDDALSEYVRARDEGAQSMYGWTTSIARPVAPAERTLALIEMISTNPDATSRFLGLFSGATHREDFFAPESLQLLVAGSAEPIR